MFWWPSLTMNTNLVTLWSFHRTCQLKMHTTLRERRKVRVGAGGEFVVVFFERYGLQMARWKRLKTRLEAGPREAKRTDSRTPAFAHMLSQKALILFREHRTRKREKGFVVQSTKTKHLKSSQTFLTGLLADGYETDERNGLLHLYSQGPGFQWLTYAAREFVIIRTISRCKRCIPPVAKRVIYQWYPMCVRPS